MCNPAVIPMIAMAMASTTAAVLQNQQVQHAKGAAEAAATAQNAINANPYGPKGAPQASPAVIDPTNSTTQAATRQAALRRGMLSTIATSGQGVAGGATVGQPAAYAPGSKTTLG